MYNANHKQAFDLCFIGSGISSTFTLIYLLENISKLQNQPALHLAIIEKHDEFHTGIPYGKRSGNSVLLITSLKNFLPEPEYSKFIRWLSDNKTPLLDQMKASGGALTMRWLEKHKESIDLDQWGELFIPRSFFGIYLKYRLKKLTDSLTSDHKLKLRYIQAEVTNVIRTNNIFTISAKGLEIQSKKVILGIGSLPTHNIYTDKNIQRHNGLLIVNQVYNPSLDENLKQITDFVNYTQKSKEHCNILIIGANASALEILYKLRDKEKINDKQSKYFFLSTHGLLPDCEVDQQKQAQFTPAHLNSIDKYSSLTAAQIAEAVQSDLDTAEKNKLGAASTVGIISSAFGKLLPKLNKEELKKFACVYGNQIGRRQRCAGQHYLNVIDDLKSKGQFYHISGRFKDLSIKNDKEYYLEYKDTKKNINKTWKNPFDVVINCIGSTSFDSNLNQIPELLQNLIHQGLITPNESHIGIEVNQNLESSENLHIVGPLLAGNIIDSKAVWHVEHCGRIIWLSGILAEIISKTLSIPTPDRSN